MILPLDQQFLVFVPLFLCQSPAFFSLALGYCFFQFLLDSILFVLLPLPVTQMLSIALDVHALQPSVDYFAERVGLIHDVVVIVGGLVCP